MGPRVHEEDYFPETTGDDRVFITFFETPCLVLYGYILFTLLTWIVWGLRRMASGAFLTKSGALEKASGRGGTPSSSSSLTEPLLGRKPDKPSPVPLCVHTMTDVQGRMVTFEGYKDSQLGKLASYLVPLTSFMFVFVFVVVLYDYYYGCRWEWPEQLCYIGTFPLTGDFNTNSYVFLVVWGSAVAWFGLLVCGRSGQMGNLFRMRAVLNRAKYVHVTVQEKDQSISSGKSRMMNALAKACKYVCKKLGFGLLPGGVFGLSGMPSQTLLMQYDSELKVNFVEFRCVRYVLDPAHGFVQSDPKEALSGGWEQYLRILQAGGLRQKRAAVGGDIPTQDEMFRAAGPNRIPFEVDKWGRALAEEFATFFFLYQFSIYAVCMWFSYWHYTIIAVSIAASSAFFNVHVRITSQREIKGMMDQSYHVEVMRDGKITEVHVEHVVPGDLVRVQGNDWSVPCDLLLLKGDAVCDESTLTGEALPVQRSAPTEPLSRAQTVENRPPAKHVLVAGTSVLQVSSDECWAIATHTGTNTQKGQLLLLILYPPKLLFKYDEQLTVVSLLLVAYAIFVMYYVMKIMYDRYATQQNLPFTATWASAIFTCSCVLPTMIHIVLSVGQVVAAERLKAPGSGVFCAAPKRIALAGKVRVACFDKTGTMTEPSLRFFGVLCTVCKASKEPFSGRLDPTEEVAALEEESRMDNLDPEVLHALASTHSLSPFSGNEAGVVGNAVEVNMFLATGWKLLSQTEVQSPREKSGPTLRILKRFDFSHSTMTMSSVVEHVPTGQRCAYVKGAYDQVLRRCRPDTVPKDTMKRAQALAFSGMYVLGIGASVLPKGAQVPMTREESEKNLAFVGLLLFKNPLRHDTREAMERLREGEVRCVMITGDAAGTGICIAKEASLVAPGVPVLLGDIPMDAKAGEGVTWRCQEEDLTAMNELLLGNDWLTWRKNYKQWRMGQGSGARGEAASGARKKAQESDRLGGLRRKTWTIGEAEEAADDADEMDQEVAEEEFTFTTEELVLSRLFEWCELAVTQKAYEWLQAASCTPDLRRVLLGSRMVSLKKGKALSSGKGNSSLAWELLTCIRIFARATPMGKISVVEGLMQQGLICAMCGDGGNDSGALRTAHVGMALSNASSATVVAPFTTNRGSVMPMVDLIREGRAALATSFAGYKYCIHYGLLNSYFKFFTYYYGVGQCMAGRYLQDLVGFLSFSWAITLSRPKEVLVGQTPTSSLFSVNTWGSVVGMWCMNMYVIRLGFVFMQMHPDYQPFPVHLVNITHWWKLSRNWETNLLFFFYTFQQFWSAVVFSFGNLFRENWYRNMVLFTCATSGFAFLLALALGPASTLTRSFHLMWEVDIEHEPWSPSLPCAAMPMSVRLGGLALLGANCFCTAIWEQVFINGFVGSWCRERLRRWSKHITLRL